MLDFSTATTETAAMNHYLELVAVLALALTWGGMTFFSVVMAPLVFTKLR
jgi:hypothetical protein